MKALRFGCLVWLVLALFAAAALAEEPVFTGYTVKEAREESLAEGVTYAWYTLLPPDGEIRYGQRISLIRVEAAARGRVRLLAVTSSARIHKGLQALTGILNGEQKRLRGTILAGVNADFFDMTAGGAVGHLKSAEEWLIAGEFPGGWACGMTVDGELLIGQPKAGLTLTLPDGTTATINALNGLRGDTPSSDTSPTNVKTARKDNDLVLFTAAYGRNTFTQSGGVEVVLRPDGALTGEGPVSARVEKVVHQRTRGGTSIREGLMVLSGVREGAETLKRLKAGDTVQLEVTVQPPFDQSTFIVGGGRPDGGPLLMWAGETLDLTEARSVSVDEAYFYRHHPRTVIGTYEDGSYFLLAIEGNRQGCFGMTLEETQALLRDLGAYTALNLDGGPSTTMAVRQDGKIKAVTDTTGGKGRLTPVGSAIILLEGGPENGGDSE